MSHLLIRLTNQSRLNHVVSAAWQLVLRRSAPLPWGHLQSVPLYLGAVTIGGLIIGRARIRLTIDELVVGKLQIKEESLVPKK